jgi:hypothetical protein
MESHSEAETEGRFPEVRLVRKGMVLVASIPGAPKVSVEETNGWIRKSRHAEMACPLSEDAAIRINAGMIAMGESSPANGLV